MKFRVQVHSVSDWITLDTEDRDADPVYCNPRIKYGDKLVVTGKFSNESWIVFDYKEIPECPRD